MKLVSFLHVEPTFFYIFFCFKITELLYKFKSDDHESFNYWVNVLLKERQYNVFNGDLHLYDNNPLLFARGFQSPTQNRVMRQSVSFCLDATHSITSRSMEVLYTLLTRHPVTGTGYPVAFMVTNDQTVGPVNQWLVHLRDTCNLSATFITIDCCIAEVNAIKAALPETGIHYCGFHVLKAWKVTGLGKKVKLDASYTTEQLATYKKGLLDDLNSILREGDKTKFLEKISAMKTKFAAQSNFITYFENNWSRTEELLGRWGKPYVAENHRRYLTNNYIESWHNQLKTVYFGRARNRRLDRLSFILTGDVEFYFEQEVERIALNNGKMSPLERELSLRSYKANQVEDTKLPLMITNPANYHSSSSSNSNDGVWKVASFNTETSSNVPYSVSIQNNLITKCSCLDFAERQAPCKHMYLLKRFTSVDLSFLVERAHFFANDFEETFFDDDASIGGQDFDVDIEFDTAMDVDIEDKAVNVEEVVLSEDVQSLESEEVSANGRSDEENVSNESENIDILYQSILSKITTVYHQKK